MADDKIRLQKYLAECGVASRRKSEELIAAGKVKVNGVTALIGDKVNPKHDKVTVSGKKVVSVKKNVYIMLNKPRGFITTMNDEHDRKCVAELVKDINVNVIDSKSAELIKYAIDLFDELTNVLGLVYNRDTGSLDEEIEKLIEARQNARKEKNWAEADRIRDELKAQGIVLEDTPQGVKWHRE